MKEWFGHYRATLGFLFIVAGFAFLLWQQQVEQNQRTLFDARRQYDICLDSNERTEKVNARFDNLDKLLVSFSPNDPRVPAFLESEKAATIPLRDCEPLLKSATEEPS